MQRPFSPCEEEEEGKGGMTADAEGEEDGGAALWTADGGDSPLPVLGDVTRRNRGLEGERKGRNSCNLQRSLASHRNTHTHYTHTQLLTQTHTHTRPVWVFVLRWSGGGGENNKDGAQ